MKMGTYDSMNYFYQVRRERPVLLALCLLDTLQVALRNSRPYIKLLSLSNLRQCSSDF